MQNAAPQPSWPQAGIDPQAAGHDAAHQAWLAEVQARAQGQHPDMGGEQEIPMRTAVMVLGLVVPLLVVVGGLVWLFGSEAEAPVKPAAAAKTLTVDGTLTVVEEDRLVMKPFEPLDGQPEVEFVIRPEDLKNFDIPHMQSHSSLALPVRISYEREGDQLFAIYKEDAPANSKPAEAEPAAADATG